MTLIETKGNLVESETSDPVSRDPKDDPYLFCAKEGQCQFIVSGDKDLLTLGNFDDVQIITPAQFVKILELETRKE